LFIEDRGDVKICLVAKLDVVGTRCALKPLRQLLLRTFLTEIVKAGTSLFITVLILKDRSSMLTSKAGTIPQVSVSDISFEAPNEYPGWYSAHQWLLIERATEEKLLAMPRF